MLSFYSAKGEIGHIEFVPFLVGIWVKFSMIYMLIRKVLQYKMARIQVTTQG